MARQTVDLGSVSTFAKGVGNVGSGSVQYKANPNAGSSAGMLAKSLGVALDVSQQNDRRKKEEENARFQTEFNSYVSKALQDDNKTGIEELDTLYPDMNMTRKLLILEASGKTAIQRDEGFQSIIAGIGTQTTDDDGNIVGTPNTLDGINAGYQQAEQYIRENNADANAPYLSGMLGYLEAQRAAQVQQFVAGKRADELSATVNQFETTDKALAAVGDWDALLARDLTWKEAGGNDFIQGKDRNAAILNSSYNQALLDRDITSLSKAPEEYKGMMKGKPQLWQSYLEDVQRQIDKLVATDTAAKLKQSDDARKAREQALLDQMIKGDPPLTQDEIREVEANSSLSASRQRLRLNTGVSTQTSAINLAGLVGQLKEVDEVEELEQLGLSEEALNKPEEIIRWASTQPNIHPNDVPALIQATQDAYYVADVKNSNEHKRFETQINSVLEDIRNVSILDDQYGQAAGLLNQDSTFYARGKTIAKDEFSELVEIYREENGNEKLTKRQLKEIRELVVAKTTEYVESFKNKSVAQAAKLTLPQSTEDLRNTSNEYRDPESGIIYPVITPEEAAEILATVPAGVRPEFKQISPNRLIQTQ
jgi:hypothetical protein